MKKTVFKMMLITVGMILIVGSVFIYQNHSRRNSHDPAVYRPMTAVTKPVEIKKKDVANPMALDIMAIAIADMARTNRVEVASALKSGAF